MNIIITGRNFTVTDSLKETVGNKLRGIFEDKSLKISSATAVLSIEKNRCRAEVVVHYKNHEASASVEGFDMYMVIDEAIAKLDAQLVKFLDKVQDHKAKPLRDVTAPTEPMPE